MQDALDNRLHVALLADFAEEGWPSMDLVADMLFEHLSEAREPALEIERLRPAMRRRFGHRQSGAAWSLDRLVNRFFDYPRYLRGQRAWFDLFHLADHSYSQLVHELPPGRTIVTCHDLDTFRCLWEPARGGRGRLFQAMTRRIILGLQKAAHVCCDSEATRDEILARKLLAAERLSVVRLGLRPGFGVEPPQAARTRIDQLLGTKVGTPDTAGTVDLLHVGSTIARKRIDVLLHVFARVRQEVEPRARLLRVGGAFTPAQWAQVARLGLPAGSVCVLPFLTPAELGAVYHQASLVLLPSDAEGFGLPVIEALACGTPVLASDLPVLREVGGSAASYAPVADINAWVNYTKVLLDERSEALSLWQARRERCRRQGAKYSWKEAARQTLEIYHRVLAEAKFAER